MKISSERIHPDLRRMGNLLNIVTGSQNTSEAMSKAGQMTQKTLFRRLMNRPKKGIVSQTRQVDQNHRAPVEVMIYQRKEKAHLATGLLWIHGGGYAMGMPELESRSYISHFIEAANTVVVSPNYRLSYQAKAPQAAEDCYTALLWMVEHAEELGIRSDQIAVGGDSAGGGLAAAVVLMARDRGEVNIAFQMPFYPMLDDRMMTASSQYEGVPVWDAVKNRAAWQLYLDGQAGTADISPYAAPARETDYHNLPPLYTFVGDIEPFHDEVLTYVEQMKAAGGQASVTVYPGCYHAFDQLAPKAKISQIAREAYLTWYKQAVNTYTRPQPNASLE